MDIMKRFFRKLAGCVLQTVQTCKLYRSVGRRIAAGIVRVSAIVAENDTTRIFIAKNEEDSKHQQVMIRFVAKFQRWTAGTVYLLHREDAADPFHGFWIFSLQVRSVFRGMGIGERLVSLALAEARRRGASSVFILVEAGNSRAFMLYSKMGFKQVTGTPVDPLVEKRFKEKGIRLQVMTCRIS